MLKNIEVVDLKPGMQVVVPGEDRAKKPFAYAGDELVGSEPAVEHILAQGYREVYVDLARSAPKTAKNAGQAPAQKKRTFATPAQPVARTSLKEEFPQASRIHDETVAYARQFMIAMSTGKLDIAPATPLVENIMASLERNPDALLCLSRMRQRDVYTYTHCANVAILTASFARSTGADADRVFACGLAGLFHDLGKALLPSSLLTARRKLNITEQSIMMRHPMLGCERLAALPDVPSEMLMAALEHHERYDGSGYPKGLSGDSISEIGHMVGIVDTYDALSSQRPYKGALYPHKSLGVMYQMRKKHFHPELVEKFVRMVGIYPVGSVVELKHGFRGVVTASNPENPMKPVIALSLDPQRRPMHGQLCDLAREGMPGVASCIPAEISGIDPCQVLGFSL